MTHRILIAVSFVCVTATFASTIVTLPGASSNTAASIDSGEAVSNSFAELQYFVEVTGPTSTVQVTVNSLGSVSGSFSQPGNDQGVGVDAKLDVQRLLTDETNITVNDSGGSVENGFAPSISDNGFNSTGSPTGGYSGSLLETKTFTMNTGVAYLVDLQVKANTLSQGPGLSANVAASVDPTFTVASDGQYSFAFSPRIGNTPASTVPEPGMWAILSSGLLLIAGIDRRVRRVPTVRY